MALIPFLFCPVCIAILSELLFLCTWNIALQWVLIAIVFDSSMGIAKNGSVNVVMCNDSTLTSHNHDKLSKVIIDSK